MKITKRQLRKIINEEKQKLLVEMDQNANASRAMGLYANVSEIDAVENAIAELLQSVNQGAFEDMGDEDGADEASAAVVTLAVAQSFQGLGLFEQYQALMRTLK